ncbi:MAG: iron uptake porin, partial [Rivularia sp. ALOHA_DT_140]|nr:iron uptake porin [Rivularia sp. ALOHA_DT_140]
MKNYYKLLVFNYAIFASFITLTTEVKAAPVSSKAERLRNSLITKKQISIDYQNYRDNNNSSNQISQNNTDSETIYNNQNTLQQKQQSQVTSVSQLDDVSPGDWAFEALQKLVERYNCISGYPNGTFQGNRAMTRYEFAAGVNACIEDSMRMFTLPLGLSNPATQEDFNILQRLESEFAAELATLRGRVDNLEAKSASLEANQFSTTTKLRGVAVFSLNSAFGDEKANGSGDDIEDNIVFNNRMRLNFDTSFTGKDLLKLRLDALDITTFGLNVTGTNMTRLAYERNTNNQVDIGKLFYRFPVNKKLRLHIDATGGRFNLNASDNFNKLFANPIIGSISRFGRFNPIYIQGALGTGITAVYDFDKSLSLSLGYLARNGDNPSNKNGLFDGSYAALAQLAFKPSKKIDLGLTYVKAYYPGGRAFVSGATGSRLANAPFGRIATSADHFGFQSSFRLSKKVVISGWAGLTNAQAEDNGVFNGAPVNQNDDANIFNWAVTLGLPNLGKKGSLAGFVVGQPPTVTDSDVFENDDKSWHLESFYRYPVNDNIS